MLSRVVVLMKEKAATFATTPLLQGGDNRIFEGVTAHISLPHTNQCQSAACLTTKIGYAF